MAEQLHKGRVNSLYMVLIVLIFNGCKIGWVNLENKKYKSRTETKPFKDLPINAQCFIKDKIKNGSYHNAFSNDTDVAVLDYFLVSADYEGAPFRKMGHYIKTSKKKYFLEYKKGEPIIIIDGVLYYTFSLNLGKGTNQKEDWLDHVLFYCVHIK